MIASELPGFTEYIEDGVTGYLFEARNHQDLYRVLKTVVTAPETSLEEMRKKLEEYVTGDLRLDSIIANYLEFFDEL